ncbi:MAG TPA: serine/threonine-protein kinase [Gemmataceae bacterium]|nr:serine/threonine-protein kinase [Gemmataceae bacterium]
MTDDTRDATTSHAGADDPEPTGVEVGIGLLLRAEDHGDWEPLVDWLARNPGDAAEVADFLAVQRKLRSSGGRAPAPASPPGTVGGMELKGEVGRGGMGVVYRAFDPMLKWEVAVKMIRPGAALSPTELARFRFEAETVAGLDHPSIVRVLSFGEAGGVPYLVMPLLTGGSLAQRLKDLGPDRLPAKEAARLVRDIALGVHHAHQRGRIHRDLKPGNILLDRDGLPHVADFGLARPLDVRESVSGHIAGTPAYMAPEQARGEKGLTMAVDVHADAAPPVRQFRPDADRDLEAVCMKCLSKDARDRHPSAAALADDLTRFLNDEAVGVKRSGLVFATVSRALGWQRETLGMASWRVAFWGAASTAVAMTAMQAAVLLDAPLWVLQACVVEYLVVWVAILLYFHAARWDTLNPIERASSAVHFGIKFGCAALLPAYLWLHGGNPVYVLPAFLVVIGMGLFVHGFVYWGRFFLVGLLFYALAAAMPLVPVRYWPGVYGVTLVAFQLFAGFHLRRVHKRTDAGRPTD